MMSTPRITPTFKQTPATWVALTAAHDSGTEQAEPQPANFKGLHAADMAGVLARVGFVETDRKETDVMRAFTMRSPAKGLIIALVEVSAPQLFTSAAIHTEVEE